VGADQDDILVAGFEAFQLFQRGVEGAAGGVDAVLASGVTSKPANEGHLKTGQRA
jgi:hypothetical protein